MTIDDSFAAWLAAAERRYLADLTRAELGRALRALSSCYVERRSRLAEGAPLATAGKRAAFALFYAPLHFLTVRGVVEALRASGTVAPTAITDLGCGTGAAGAAWALSAGDHVRVSGFDVNAWAVREAAWTYHTLGVYGLAQRRRLERVSWKNPGTAVLAAFVVNELPDAERAALLPRLLAAGRDGHQVLIVEPIARRPTPWWAEWKDAFAAGGGQSREWRFPTSLPDLLRQLDRAAGLDHRELTARTLWIAPGVDPDA